VRNYLLFDKWTAYLQQLLRLLLSVKPAVLPGIFLIETCDIEGTRSMGRKLEIGSWVGQFPMNRCDTEGAGEGWRQGQMKP